MKVDIDLEGFDKLDNALKQLPLKVQRRVLQNAATSAIRVGAKSIKKDTPRGVERSPASEQYGQGYRNIRVKRTKPRGANRNFVSAKVDTKNAFWLYFYEKGTRYQPARPFFGRAFQNAVPQMLAKLKERLSIGIEREVKKLK
jgi:HK97 gp10 family phage protein